MPAGTASHRGGAVKKPTGTEDFAFGCPAVYHIVVQGRVNETWSGRLGGLAIMTSDEEDGDPQTTLRGTLPDQSALRGIIETLYALHLPILEVRKIGEPQGREAVKDSRSEEGP